MRGGVKTAFFEMHHSIAFDITHCVADVVQREMDNYSGPFSCYRSEDKNTKKGKNKGAEDRKEEKKRGESNSVAYSGIVDIRIIRNPNKAVHPGSTSADKRNRRSYARLIMGSVDLNSLEAFVSYISARIPALLKYCKAHKMHSYSTIGHNHPTQSIDSIAERNSAVNE